MRTQKSSHFHNSKITFSNYGGLAVWIRLGLDSGSRQQLLIQIPKFHTEFDDHILEPGTPQKSLHFSLGHPEISQTYGACQVAMLLPAAPEAGVMALENDDYHC